jgi:hypothetical protein
MRHIEISEADGNIFGAGSNDVKVARSQLPKNKLVGKCRIKLTFTT